MHRFVVMMSVDFDAEPSGLQARLLEAQQVAEADERVMSAVVAVRPTALLPVVELAMYLDGIPDELAAAAAADHVRARLHEHVFSRLTSSITFGRPVQQGWRG